MTWRPGLAYMLYRAPLVMALNSLHDSHFGMHKAFEVEGRHGSQAPIDGREHEQG